MTGKGARIWPGLLLAAVGSVAFSGKAIIVKLAYRHGVAVSYGGVLLSSAVSWADKVSRLPSERLWCWGSALSSAVYMVYSGEEVKRLGALRRGLDRADRHGGPAEHHFYGRALVLAGVWLLAKAR